MDNKWLWRALTVAVLAAGIGTFAYWIKTKPTPAVADRGEPGALVEVERVTASREQVRVVASGTVMAAQAVALSPEVGGRLQWLHPGVVPGGVVKAGTLLARVDSRDYQLAVDQLGAQVDRAATELEVERSRKKIAEREWQLLGEDRPAEALALRDPQMRTAQAAVVSAQSSLQRARLNVGKTALRAPFNAVIQSKAAGPGQLVGPQTPIATLVGTDAFWVQVSIPMDRLRWIRVPGVGGATEGSTAWVTQEVGGDRIVREGRVIQLLGELDPIGRMARVLVEIADPLGLRAQARAGDEADDEDAPEGADAAQSAPARRRDSGLPLLLNAYVSVEIEGAQVADAIEVPREALHDGDSVYVMTEQDTLDIRTVDVLWRRKRTVLVRASDEPGVGLRAGERVVVSPLGTPAAGLKLRTPDMLKVGPAPSPAGEGAPERGDGPSARAVGTPAAKPAQPDPAAAGQGGAGQRAQREVHQ